MADKKFIFDSQTYLAMGFCFIIIPTLMELSWGKMVLLILGVAYLLVGLYLGRKNT